MLATWWGPTPDRGALVALLSGWGAQGVGPVLSLEDALTELRETLQRTPHVEGQLTDRSVRVLTPMGLLGGAFDRVLVTGMTEGRLPRRPAEDPLLPDRLIAELNAQLSTSLVSSADLAVFEARRFASIVAACTGTLWLSAPASEMLRERPLLPSSFLLHTAGVLLGRRARYSDLEDLQQRQGSRAHPWPERPERAVSAPEHRIAITAVDPDGSLKRLCRHATGRRLIGLHRALDTACATPFTGRVSPDTIPVPGLDGAPVSPRTLAQLVNNPGRFFVEDVLEVRRAPRLYAGSDPLRGGRRDRQLLGAVRAALAQGDPTLPAILEAWDASMDEWRAHRVDVTDELVALGRAMAAHRLGRLARAGAIPRGTPCTARGRPVDGLPWEIEGQRGWIHGGAPDGAPAEEARPQPARA